MTARALWKGSLKVGSGTVPIKMYAAVQDRDIHFHVLQSTTKSRVKQEMVSEDREQVEKAEIRKGYEVEPGTQKRSSCHGELKKIGHVEYSKEQCDKRRHGATLRIVKDARLSEMDSLSLRFQIAASLR